MNWLSKVWNYINSQGYKKWGLLLRYLCFPLTAIIEIFFLVFRFPPSSPLKPYPKRPPYQKDIIKFPKWNDPPPGTSQENIPVRPLVMVSASSWETSSTRRLAFAFFTLAHWHLDQIGGTRFHTFRLSRFLIKLPYNFLSFSISSIPFLSPPPELCCNYYQLKV